jgi:hypothetical protein
LDLGPRTLRPPPRNQPQSRILVVIFKMAALTTEQVAAGLTMLDADLAWILEDTGVAKELRGKIGHLGIRRLNTFAKLEADEGRFRGALKNLFGLTPPHGHSKP